MINLNKESEKHYNNKLKLLWKHRLNVFTDNQLLYLLRSIKKLDKLKSKEEMVDMLVEALDNNEIQEHKINFFVNDKKGKI